MTAIERREIFGDGRDQRRRSRTLRATLWIVAGALICSVLTELLPVPETVSVVAVVVAIVAIVVAWRAIDMLTVEERRDRKHAEATIELAGSMLVAIDTQARIRLANSAACHVFGRTEEELLGAVLPTTVFAAEEHEASMTAFGKVLDGTINPRGHRQVRTIERPDGSRRRVAWHVAVRPDGSGGIAGLLISGVDVTDDEERERLQARDREDVEQLRYLAQDVAAHDDARDAVVQRIQTMLGAGIVVLAQPVADGSGDFEYTASTDAPATDVRLTAEATSATLLVARSGEPLFIADATDDPRVNQALVTATGVVSVRIDPVKHQGEVVGVLAVGWTTATEELDERRALLLGLAADETAIALERVSTLERLETIALTDPLTGIPNRRAFDRELDRAIAAAARTERPLTLAVLDLNEFKALNDRLGHDAGDALLAGCAGAWEATLRASDMIARLGGDEFAVILPDCGAGDAETIVNRLRHATPHAPGAGAGFATFAGETAFELYQLADRALYADKALHRAGRITAPERLAAVDSTGLERTDGSPEIDALRAEVSSLLDLPGVYVNLVGAEWLTHLSRPADAPGDGMPVSDSYCQHVVASGQPFVVADGHDEVGLRGNASLAAGLTAYAGTPLSDEDGNVVGALCAVDSSPRAWSAAELRVLDHYAARVSEQLSATTAAAH